MANVLPTESEDESDAADSVSPVELFFDLVFVFAFVRLC
jgi:low temperature requirement protein LtrA